MTQPSTQTPFITLDGIDGVGKSTQIQRLGDHLKSLGHDVLSVRDPGSTPIGMKLRELLLESDLDMHRRTEAMLFMASRCEMIETTIRPALESGKTIVSDRFLLANVVYQSVGGEASAELLWNIGRLANNGMEPTLTLLLDMPADEAMRRFEGPADRMEKRGVEYLESVRQAFLQQLKHSGSRTAVINAAQNEDAVARDILSAVEPILK
ncbi:MAG: dTMP kinase [Planctomycetota bacterium]